MKRIFFALLLTIGFNTSIFAQYWVEFDQGACTVGPPPVCVVGHWYWVEAPNTSTALTASTSTDQSKDIDFEKPSEVSTDLEYETFSYPSLTGRSIGLRGIYEKALSSGISYGARATYTTSTVEFDGTSESMGATIISVNFYASRPISDYVAEYIQLPSSIDVFASGGLFYSSYNNEVANDPLTSLGPFVSINFITFTEPFNLSGGISYTISKVKYEGFLDESKSTLNFGFNGGRPIGENLYGSAEIFRLKDGIYVIGGTLRRYRTENFTLVLGLKRVFGIDNFSNMKITLGSTIRF